MLSTVQPEEIVNALPATGPEQGESMATIFEDFEKIVLPGITHWNHPDFLAYFANTSSPPAVLAELLAAALNANGILWKTSPAVTELEIVTHGWLLALVRACRASWFGMIFDTASISTLHALAAARVFVAPETRDAGAPRNLVVYCSDQAHSSVEKGAMALGFGRNNVRRIASDARVPHASPAARSGHREGPRRRLRPCCVVATVGTTSTTSIDPVPEIADIAEREGLWLHVDAAYAGSAAVCRRFRWFLDGCERADSLVFNPHKWLMVPVDCSVFYCRSARRPAPGFSLVPEIPATTDGGAQHDGLRRSRWAAVSAR